MQRHAILLPKHFNFLIQWLLRWKRKRNISQTEIHGKAGSACLAGIELCHKHLPRTLREFKLEGIYNLEDTSLFFRRLLTRSLIRGLEKGMKISKLRCTVNLIANATCSDINLQVIGSTEKPRAFGKVMKPYETYRIDYYNNRTSWMRTEIFVDVIEKFSNRVRRRGGNVLLLMENFQCMT